MENGPPTLAFDDGTVDVERLLVEPQDGHVSVDSAMCFNGKMSEKAMDISEVSCGFGVASSGIAHEGEDILNRDVLDTLHTEDDGGYFRLQNDFCNMGEEYLLEENCCAGYSGVGFAEAITDLEYVSSSCLQTSVSDGPGLTCAGIESPWKADLFRTTEVSECQNLLETPSPEKKPPKSPDENILKVHNISGPLFDDIPSDENCTSVSQPVEMLPGPKNAKKDENGETKTYRDKFDAPPTQKRSRKPTKRYIDEVADPISRHPKRRQDVSSSTIRDKFVRVKDHKKCHMGAKAVKLPAEESAVEAIQVPFGSLVHKECSDSPSHIMASAENQKKRDERIPVHQIKRSDHSTTTTQLTKRNDTLTTHRQKTREHAIIAVSPKKKDECVTTISQRKRDVSPTADSPEEVSGRRKHHRLWTIAEVKKLLDGVSDYGVGRWSRIKKVFFSLSAHRTSVDLKDKWRNLLKASGLQGKHNQKGDKKRNVAWRPLPKSMLRRVCELAAMHPYPKGKIAHISPDRSTDITLRDFRRRILRSINTH